MAWTPRSTPSPVGWLALVLDYAFRSVRLRLATGIHEETNHELNREAFESLVTARVQALNRLDAGFKAELLEGLNTIRQAYSPVNLVALLDLPFVTIYLVAIFLLSPTLGVLAFLLVTVVLGLTLFLQKKSYETTQQMAKAVSGCQKMAGSAMLNQDSIRAFNARKAMEKRWLELLTELREVQGTVNVQQGRIQSLIFSFAALTSVVVIFFVALQVVDMHIGIGTMIGANILASRSLAPVTRFASMSLGFTRASLAIKLLKNFASLPKENETGLVPSEFQGRLSFKDLSFRYPGAPLSIFKSQSMDVKPGEFVVVIGPNGSGKITMARLVMGLMEPQRGQVLVDGADLRQLQLSWWRRQVIFLPQEPHFFEGTVRENLLASRADASDEELNASLEKVDMFEFIAQNPQGLDLPLRGGGLNLAMGQRRRLAMARALLNDGKHLMLDELHEGMDSAGIRAMLALLQEMRQQKKTVLLLTHHPGDRYPKCDRVIEPGKFQRE